MISIKGLEKSYGKHEVLKKIDLEVAEGEIYGFIGHNGAGKSTTMNILAGLMYFQNGVCQINGVNIKKGHPLLFKELGYLPEEPRFYLYMSANEYLDFIGTMGGKSVKECRHRTSELLELVQLKKSANRPIGEFSRGMKQRLGLAVAMYHNPKTLLLDEPSSALDPMGRKDVVDIIGELKNQGKTIFLSTHILGDVERICDRIGILHGGKIIIEDRLETLLSEYIQPIYDVEFEVLPTQEELALLDKLSFIKGIELLEKRVSITVKDPQENSEELLRTIAPLGGNITSIQLRRSSLEDVYMKVVKQNV